MELFWGYGKALEMGREWPMIVKTPTALLGPLVLFFAKRRVTGCLRRGSPVCQCCFPVTVGGRAERRREGQVVVQEQTGLSLCSARAQKRK